MTAYRYTVLLLRPDYCTSDFGQDTYMTHVFAVSPPAAVELAQIEAVRTDYGDEVEDATPHDYFPLVVFAGHLDDLTPKE